MWQVAADKHWEGVGVGGMCWGVEPAPAPPPPRPGPAAAGGGYAAGCCHPGVVLFAGAAGC
jgi:hypothetical protein